MDYSKIPQQTKEIGEKAEGELSATFFLSLAEPIVHRGLAVPAKLFLEMHKPLCGVLYNLSLLSAPVLFMLFGRDFQQKVEMLFESSENIERLIQTIEGLEERA